jgi:hypothetical protein
MTPRRGRFSLWFLPLMILPLACMQSHDSSAPISGPQYTLSGGVNTPGPRALHSGDTISTVLAQNMIAKPGEPLTVVLVRRGPEGRTRKLIQIDANGKLMDLRQNYTLLDGDEIVFPGNGVTAPRATVSPPNS